VGAIAAFFVSVFVRESPRYAKGKPIDWWGIALLAAGIGSLQVVLEKGETEDWFQTPYISVLTLTTVLAGIAFVWRELSTDHPVVNFKILKNRSFAIGIVTSFVLGFALYGSVFVFPIFCQNLLGFNAQQTGIILFPSGMATILLMPFVGIMLKRGIPGQFMATGGFFLFFIFTLMLSNSTLESGTSDFFWPLVIRGIGMAILFVPLTTLALQELKGPEIGQGSGLNNMMRQLGGSFGVALLTTLIHVKSGEVRNVLLEHVNPYNPAYVQRNGAMVQNFMHQGRSALDAQQMANRAMEGNIIRQTMLVTYDHMYLVIGVFVLCCIPIVYLQRFKKNAAMPVDAH
jgi:DHA2 family multidrug resistance protein